MATARTALGAPQNRDERCAILFLWPIVQQPQPAAILVRLFKPAEQRGSGVANIVLMTVASGG